LALIIVVALIAIVVIRNRRSKSKENLNQESTIGQPMPTLDNYGPIKFQNEYDRVDVDVDDTRREHHYENVNDTLA
jgi:flagellar biosynthesis/type III secretory pathway M-ring protein FliF/YscJ